MDDKDMDKCCTQAKRICTENEKMDEIRKLFAATAGIDKILFDFIDQRDQLERDILLRIDELHAITRDEYYKNEDVSILLKKYLQDLASTHGLVECGEHGSKTRTFIKKIEKVI